MRQQRFPDGWDEKRVRKIIDFYESQTEEEAVAEDEAAFEDHTTRLWKFQMNWCASCPGIDRQTYSIVICSASESRVGNTRSRNGKIILKD